MNAVILNSGTGSRMGVFTKNNHKCMIEIMKDVPLLHYQISMLKNEGINEIVITTGHREDIIRKYIDKNFEDMNIKLVHNLEYLNTNYIYSMYLALNELNEDTILLHGDLYFEEKILDNILNLKGSCVVIDSTLELPDKDFKAMIEDNKVKKIATYINGEGCLACQPLYKLELDDWNLWKEKIKEFCESGQVNVYAEEALNEVLDRISLHPLDIKGKLCMEVDTLEDLEILKSKLNK